MSVSSLKQVEFLPVVSFPGNDFAISNEEARSIVEAHVEVTNEFDVPNVVTSSHRGMVPYKAVVAMALRDLGFGDLLSTSEMQFSETDIELLEQHFPFLICIKTDVPDTTEDPDEKMKVRVS